jgi:hypothetical protein
MAADSPGPAPSPEFQSAAQGSHPAPTYNEVFFQRRADEERAALVSEAPVAPSPEEVVIAAPVEPVIEAAQPLPSVDAPFAPVETIVDAPKEEAAASPEPAPVPEVIPTVSEVEPTVVAAQPEPVMVASEPVRAEPENEKGGFLNRLFGKFRK